MAAIAGVCKLGEGGGGGGIEATIVRGRKPQRITQTEKVQLRTGGETASW